LPRSKTCLAGDHVRSGAATKGGDLVRYDFNGQNQFILASSMSPVRPVSLGTFWNVQGDFWTSNVSAMA
jgi:hypothetical protein